jgi:hypothetical protein
MEVVTKTKPSTEDIEKRNPELRVPESRHQEAPFANNNCKTTSFNTRKEQTMLDSSSACRIANCDDTFWQVTAHSAWENTIAACKRWRQQPLQQEQGKNKN